MAFRFKDLQPRELCRKLFGKRGHHGVFGAEMISVDQIDPELSGKQELMILDIRGQPSAKARSMLPPPEPPMTARCRTGLPAS